MSAAIGTAPVSPVLREAARLDVTVWPDWLPDSAACLYEAVRAGLAPLLRLTDTDRGRVALDTAVWLCCELAGTRLTPSTAHAAEPLVRRAFAAHGIDRHSVPHALHELATACRGGLLVPTARAVEKRLRNACIRRDYQRGDTDYAAMARRYGLGARQVRYILGAWSG